MAALVQYAYVNMLAKGSVVVAQELLLSFVKEICLLHFQLLKRSGDLLAQKAGLIGSFQQRYCEHTARKLNMQQGPPAPNHSEAICPWSAHFMKINIGNDNHLMLLST
jgi:hypothetical protein